MSDARTNWNSALRPTPDCIPIEHLADQLTSEERRHLAHCVRCQTEVVLYQEWSGATTAAEAADVEWIAQTIAARVAGDVVPLAPGKKRQSQKPLAIAATLLLLVGIGYLVQRREPSIDVPAGSGNVYRSSRIDVISPAGDLATAPAELRWSPVAGATNYDVRLTEVDHTIFWRATARDAHVQLPADVVARFVPGKTILWEVTARRDAAVVASTGTQRFRVKPQ